MSAKSNTKASEPFERTEDWAERLHEVLVARQLLPFAWGKQDCCLLAADLVAAMCGGRDAAKGLRGYKNALGAARKIKAHGGWETMLDGIAARCGFKPLPGVLWARRGDLCEMENFCAVDQSLALGICLGQVVACAGETQVLFVALNKARRAWRVG